METKLTTSQCFRKWQNQVQKNIYAREKCWSKRPQTIWMVKVKDGKK
jgi:hypothetical protein